MVYKKGHRLIRTLWLLCRLHIQILSGLIAILGDSCVKSHHISLIRSCGYYLFQALTRHLYKGSDYIDFTNHDNGHQLELPCAMAPILEGWCLMDEIQYTVSEC